MIIQNGQNVRYHYDIWTKEDKYGRSLLDKIVEKERKANGRESHTTMVIVDSKSIKNTSTAKEKGYDVEKNFWDKTTYWCRYTWFASCH